MADNRNATLLRAAIEAMGTGEMRQFVDLLDDNVVWHEIGGGEPVRGRAAVAERMTGDRPFTITATVHDVIANDEHTVALVNAKATRGDRTLDYRTAEIMHIRDGKVVERWAFSDDTARIAEFFA